MTPTISVIIPTYNCELYIKETINSILEQTFKSIEIIVVDDGSTDHTVDYINSFESKLVLIKQNNSGVCAARNRGIIEATGQYICLMDHDDYWFPWKLERQLLEFQKAPEVGVVYSAFIPWIRTSTTESFPEPSSFDVTQYPDRIDPDFSGWIYHQFLLDCWMLTSTAMFRKDVFGECGVFDNTLPYSEDWELWIRIARKFPFVKLWRPTTLYRQHPQQGNRITRNLDYRTLLLTNTVNLWGYCSRDGRCITKSNFQRQLAIYHAEFAFSHLKERNLKMATKSFLSAWLASPQNLKYLGYIPASLLGWKPSW